MTTLETLTAVRAVIEHPENWTIGIRKDPRGTHGYAYCALGAFDEVLDEWAADDDPAVAVLARAMSFEQFTRAFHRYVQLCNAKPGAAGIVAQFNNTSTHAEVIALIDRAISRQRTIEQMLIIPAEVMS